VKMGLADLFMWGRKKRKLVQEAKDFMISESAKQPRTWHGLMTEEWMADFAEKKMKEVSMTYEEMKKCPKCGKPAAWNRSLGCYTCECGCDFDSNGTVFAPRSQWGEETGERF